MKSFGRATFTYHGHATAMVENMQCLEEARSCKMPPAKNRYVEKNVNPIELSLNLAWVALTT